MYSSGPDAFDVWALALESGTTRRDGTSNNVLVWHECRTQVVDFIQEARQRFSGQLDPACDLALAEAGAAYTQVRNALKALTVLVPMDMQIWDGSTPLRSPSIVPGGGEAERHGLQRLQEAFLTL